MRSHRLPDSVVHIPAKYYERIPIFYFIVGILLILNAVYMGMNDFVAYLYTAAGIVSVVYAAAVYRARTRSRKIEPAEDTPQSGS